MGRLCYLAKPTGNVSWCFSQKFVPVARQVWRAFCRHGTSFIECWCGRGTIFINERKIVKVDKVCKRHWRSGRNVTCLEARKLSGCRIYITCRCASPGTGLTTCPGKWLRTCKKHDKQLTHIVRVISRHY